MADEQDELTNDEDVGEFSSRKIAEAVGAAAKVKNHLEGDHEDQCGYCGQHFGPDDIVIEKEIYGQKWKFCDEKCYNDFLEHSNFQDENLDEDKGVNVNQDLEEEVHS